MFSSASDSSINIIRILFVNLFKEFDLDDHNALLEKRLFFKFTIHFLT